MARLKSGFGLGEKFYHLTPSWELIKSGGGLQASHNGRHEIYMHSDPRMCKVGGGKAHEHTTLVEIDMERAVRENPGQIRMWKTPRDGYVVHALRGKSDLWNNYIPVKYLTESQAVCESMTEAELRSGVASHK